jgi:hypothetical protein
MSEMLRFAFSLPEKQKLGFPPTKPINIGPIGGKPVLKVQQNTAYIIYYVGQNVNIMFLIFKPF